MGFWLSIEKCRRIRGGYSTSDHSMQPVLVNSLPPEKEVYLAHAPRWLDIAEIASETARIGREPQANHIWYRARHFAIKIAPTRHGRFCRHISRQGRGDYIEQDDAGNSNGQHFPPKARTPIPRVMKFELWVWEGALDGTPNKLKRMASDCRLSRFCFFDLLE